MIKLHPITVKQPVNMKMKGQPEGEFINIPIGRVVVQTHPANFHPITQEPVEEKAVTFLIQMRNEPEVVVGSKRDATKVANFYKAKIQWAWDSIDPSGKYLTKGGKKVEQ